MKNPVVLIALLLSGAVLPAQNPVPPPRQVEFNVTPEGNAYRFTPVFPPLVPIAGAPAPYWSCYWEFGDGSFSFDNNPLHAYGKTGNNLAILEATAHYDDGEKPKGKSVALMADRTGVNPGEFPTVFESTQLPIRMKANRQARANEALALIVSYRNLGSVTTDGRLHLFFNERRFPTSHFALDSARLHYNEYADAAVSQALPMADNPLDAWTVLHLPTQTGDRTMLSAEPPPTILQNLLNTARGAYREEKIWRFNNLQPGEKRNLFVALRGTSQMLQDTNAFIHLEGIFAPFDPLVAPERFDLEIEIVSAHDPNAIIVSDSRVNYRLIRQKKLDYKVQFQNNGKGPASTVEITVEIPEGLDMKRMRPVEWYPKCPICPKPFNNRSCLDTASTKDGLVFTFRSIYLPGSRQEGVTDRDSTKGYVRYRMETERGMPKLPFRSRAKIVFDKEPPIYTNFTRTRFKVGKSPGLKVGYGFEPNFSQKDATGAENQDFIQDGYAFLGLSLSPYKSWRIYPQIELLTGIKGRTSEGESVVAVVDTFKIDNPNNIPILNTVKDSVVTSSIVQKTRGLLSFEVPFLLRKNFSSWFGVGVGGSARVLFVNGENISTSRVDSIHYSFTDSPTGFVLIRNFSQTNLGESTEKFSDTVFRYSLFGDITFGSVRSGLNLGIRGGAVLERKRKLRPFAQLSLELKL